MINCKPVKVTINAFGFMDIIFDIVVYHHGFFNSIVSDKNAVFIFNFWSSLYYFLGIKQKLSSIFYLQTNGRTKRQNISIKTYLCFINYK